MEPQEPKISTLGNLTEPPATKIINGMKFVSIGDEISREYDFVRGGGIYTSVIDDPSWLFVRQSGSHLVIDNKGVAHYVPSDFIALRWANDGNVEANF